jgi:DNA-binding response OmpR family regulator
MASYTDSMRILLVEDEAPLANVLARNLSARGYDVDVAGTAEEALALLVGIPDVIVLDVNLPDMTGWDVLRRLSEDDRARLKVIVISAAPISPKRVEEFRPARTLQKPFPLDSLVRALRELSESTEGENGGMELE